MLSFRGSLLIFLVSLCGNYLTAQDMPAGEITGLVYDKENGHPLALAHISIDVLKKGAVTDDRGQFAIREIPAGVYRLAISSLGYQREIMDSIRVDGDGTTELNLGLATDDLDIGEVVVTAAKRSQSVALAPASVSVLSSNKLENENVNTFDQAFDALTGVQVTRSSGANVQALSIRGASEVAGGGIGNRVLLLIDGRPSLSPESGGALWNLVPISVIDRVEVVKGAYSSLFGSSAMGGVINVLTKKASARSHTGAHISYGFYDGAPATSEYSGRGQYYSAAVNQSGNLGKWKYITSGGVTSNDGHREKSAFDIYHLFGKVIYQHDLKNKWIFSANHNEIKNDAPATWINRRLAYTVANHRRDDFQEKDESSLDLQYQSIRSQSLKFHSRLYYYRNFAFFSFDDDPENRTDSNINFGKQSVPEESVRSSRLGATFQADYYRGSHYMIAGLDLKSDFVNGKPDTVLYGLHRSFSSGLYLQDEVSIEDRMIITAGLRYDYFHLEDEFSESNLSPKIAAVWKQSKNSSMRLLFAGAFRNPSIAERFIKFEQGGGLRFMPNPKLRAEKLTTSIELGSNFGDGNKWNADVSLFYNRYRDLISFQQLPSADRSLLFQVVNLNRALMQGVEINFTYNPSDFISINTGYTYLDARDISENRLNDFLAYKRKHSFSGGIHAVYKSFSTDLSYRYRSPIKEVFIYPGSEPGAHSVWNGRINYQITSDVSFYISVDNFTNSLYEELERYRMPGRGYTFGIRVR